MYENVPFSGPKWPICPEQNHFDTNNYYYFHLAIDPYIRSLSYEDAPFWAKMVHLPQFFFWKIINIILIYLLAPFIVQDFKNILPMDPDLWGCAIFGSKMAHFPKWKFFQKTCWWALFLSFMPVYIPKIKVRH